MHKNWKLRNFMLQMGDLKVGRLDLMFLSKLLLEKKSSKPEMASSWWKADLPITLPRFELKDIYNAISIICKAIEKSILFTFHPIFRNRI